MHLGGGELLPERAFYLLCNITIWSSIEVEEINTSECTDDLDGTFFAEAEMLINTTKSTNIQTEWPAISQNHSEKVK